ncbi:hypothetical protein ABW20_dc0106664 [Dactylellina cionopaga]|nr:hypothetical protein ABW20_dc0106664 [Dactylellina cionopaga]
MVFTIVTTVFLPLNFVTSFFGMNTVDIRNIEQSQGIFWMTAVPVTVVILGLALVWAYYGDEIQDRIGEPYRTWGPKSKKYIGERRRKVTYLRSKPELNIQDSDDESTLKEEAMHPNVRSKAAEDIGDRVRYRQSSTYMPPSMAQPPSRPLPAAYRPRETFPTRGDIPSAPAPPSIPDVENQPTPHPRARRSRAAASKKHPRAPRR